MAIHRDRGELEAMGEVATQLLLDEPGDPEAIHLLETSCRQHGGWGRLKDALLAASRIHGSSPTTRKKHLKRAALVSERELEDVAAAINAWQSVHAVDQDDVEAITSLKRLFRTTSRWDELVALIEGEALAATDNETKAARYLELAAVHHGDREELGDAIETLRTVRTLQPQDAGARDQLCNLLLAAGGHERRAALRPGHRRHQRRGAGALLQRRA